MSITFGLEKEAFLGNANDEIIIVDTDKIYGNYDECGLLLESRGKPYDSITDAVYSLLSEEAKLNRLLKQHNYHYIPIPYATVSRSLKVIASRKFQKSLTKYQNIYGYEHHRNKLNEVTAGIHISFMSKQNITCYRKTGKNYELYKHSYSNNFDYIKYFIALDKAFKEEIRKSKRNPGFYELKSDGRIEYRSLPNNIDLNKLIDVIEGVK